MNDYELIEARFGFHVPEQYRLVRAKGLLDKDGPNELTPDATAQHANLPRVIQERVRKILLRLEDWPEVSGAKPLKGNWAGKRAVILEEAEYEPLARKADEWEPAMPEPNERGNYSVDALAVNLARDILRARRKLGLSQAELARRAGIRLQTLDRIERAKNAPAVATVDKIDKALKQAETERARG